MSIRPVLLRLFLGLVLLLDGTATAVASVHMNHLDMADAAAHVASVADRDGEGQAELPCHDAEATGAKVATTAESDSGEHEHQSPDGATQTPDCCESGACDCACVHPVQAAVVAALIGFGPLERADGVRPVFPMHASPALPHLIRPPIG